MKQVDWSKVLIRCSCIGKIMANGKGTVLTDKQAAELERLEALPARTAKQEETITELRLKKTAKPELGETAISYLKEVYMFERYGKESVGGSERSKYTIKGRSVEDESIMLLSRLDQKQYEKNKERMTNEYLTGEMDILDRDDTGRIVKVLDIKSSWDGASLLSNIGSPLNPLYYWQMQGYLALTGCDLAEVCYVLTNMPQEIIEGEKKRIFYTMNPVTEEDPTYKKAISRMENNFTFDEIPILERVVRFPVQRDETAIQKIYERVQMCREWLEKFEKMHIGLNKIS